MLHTLPVRDAEKLSRPTSLSVAVLIPCYNEELAVAEVIAGFRASLPDATMLVYDNNSSDHTRQIASSAGAEVRNETLQGKGHVVRRMFADIEADIYVLVDGDNTYDPAAAPVMVRQLWKTGWIWSPRCACPPGRTPIGPATASATVF